MECHYVKLTGKKTKNILSKRIFVCYRFNGFTRLHSHSRLQQSTCSNDVDIDFSSVLDKTDFLRNFCKPVRIMDVDCVRKTLKMAE